MSNNPEPALAAARHYRSVGRRLELAATLEDAAVLLAGAERRHEARAALDEAVEIFTGLSALWDIERAVSRMSKFAIR